MQQQAQHIARSKEEQFLRLQTEHAATQKAFEETQAEKLTLARQNERLAETVGLRDRDLLRQQEVPAAR